MVVRAVEWKLPYTGWKAIEITNRKVVNLRMRDENNLIIYDAGDNEIYTDLQLWDEIRPSSTFPVWANVGRAIEDNGWETTGTLVCFKTTSGDNIKLLYADNGKLFIDNWTWTFKQIYLKSEVDALLALKQDLLTAGDNITIDQNNVISATTGPHPILEVTYGQVPSSTRILLNWWLLPEEMTIEDIESLGGDIVLVFNSTDYGSTGRTITDIDDSVGRLYKTTHEYIEYTVVPSSQSYIVSDYEWTGLLKKAWDEYYFFPRFGIEKEQINNQ